MILNDRVADLARFPAGLTCMDFRVWLLMATMADAQGRVSTTNGELATLLHTAQPTVWSSLRRLRDRGVVQMERRGLYWLSVQYLRPVPQSAPAAP